MPSPGFNVPVIFLVYKRPALTARVLAQIREVRPERLFVVADGPRANRPGDANACNEVREIIGHGIDWPCTVVRDYADENLGCARRVSSGITNAFKQVDSAIILEDDCLPDATFFPFCAELLARYRDDRRVGQIAGCSFRPERPADDASYYFSRYPHCWGWATWRRAWQQYDQAMIAWAEPKRRDALLGNLEDLAEQKYWAHAFNGTASGRIDSWAYRWALTCWVNGWLSANAVTNLVSNVGFAPGGTHTNIQGTTGARPIVPLSFPLRHPAEVVRDTVVDRAIGNICFRRPGLFHRVRERWARIIG